MAHQKEESNYIYSSGCRLTLESHRPPLPFGGHFYKHNNPIPFPLQPAKSDNQLSYVFRHSPAATEPASHQERLQIIITKHLSAGRSHGAQTLVCNVAGKEGVVRFVKIYDPLYYAWLTEFGVTDAVVLSADRDYSREAAAYQFLSQQGYDGVLAPKYYGSWTFDLTGQQGEKRSVRLILLEYIPAPSLWQEYYQRPEFRHEDPVPPNRMTKIPEMFGDFEQFRTKVYELVLDIKTKHLHVGLTQHDYAPRNVLAALEDSKNRSLVQRLKRVVIVDYNISIVFSMSTFKAPRHRLPYNPLEVYWDRWITEFDGWIPKAWQENDDLHRKWLYEKFGSPARRQEYMPLSSEFLETLEKWRNADEKSNTG